MDLSHQLSLDELKSKKNNFKRIFFYRVCGTGMGAAACLLKEKGFEVEGGDLKFFPPMSSYLESTGIPLHDLNEFNIETLKNFDLIVVGNVVSGKSKEARSIEKLGVSFCSFPAALGAFVLGDVNVVGIAGTHGKTTTTYLLTQIFENLNMNPGYFIGGVMPGRPSAKLGGGKYFFIESDEYDSCYFEKFSKFRSYQLNTMILTSLEFDHADIFSSLEDIEQEFKASLPSIDGHLIFCSEYESCKKLGSQYPRTKFYGKDSKTFPEIIEEGSDGTKFSLNISDKKEVFITDLVGWHNILNLTACICFCIEEEIDLGQIKNSILNLSLVKRRQEVRGKYKEALVIDDFAHHPKAIQLTIEAIKTKFPGQRLLVVSEPNSATARSNIFQEDYPASFASADSLILAKPSAKTTVNSANDLDCSKVVEEWAKQSGGVGVVAENLTDLRNHIDKLELKNNILLILSNGTCLGLWESDFVNEIV